MRAKCGIAALLSSDLYGGPDRPKKAPPVCPEDELVRVFILLKIWETTLKKVLEPLFGPRVFSCARCIRGLREIFKTFEQGVFLSGT